MPCGKNLRHVKPSARRGCCNTKHEPKHVTTHVAWTRALGSNSIVVPHSHVKRGGGAGFGGGRLGGFRFVWQRDLGDLNFSGSLQREEHERSLCKHDVHITIRHTRKVRQGRVALTMPPMLDGAAAQLVPWSSL